MIMEINVPGRLYAKSLRDTKDDLIPDYKVLFSHSEIAKYERYLNQFEIRVSSDATRPVLAVLKFNSGHYLCVRYQWSIYGDLLGRRHSREEVFLIDEKSLPIFLSGNFTAVPNKESQTFCIQSNCESVMPSVMTYNLADYRLTLYAYNEKGFRFKQKPIKGNTKSSDKEKIADNGKITQNTKKQGGAVVKFISFLFVLVCVAAGLFYWKNSNKISELERDLTNIRSELQKVSERNKDLERWNGKRVNFEHNVNNMRKIFRELKKSIEDAEELLKDIDADTSSSSKKTNIFNGKKQGQINTQGKQKKGVGDEKSIP